VLGFASMARADVLAGSNSTAGLTTQNSVNSAAGETAQGEQFTVAVSGNATSLCLYAWWGHSEELVFLLTNSSGTVLATSAPTATMPAGSAGWVCGSITPTAITASQTVYIMVYGDATDTGRIPLMTNGAATGTYEATEGSFSAPASSFTLGTNGGNAHMNMYIDGTPASSGGLLLRRRRS
jgi:hypothetical protein